MGSDETGPSTGSGPGDPLGAARERVLAEHRGTLEATLDAADAAATDPAAVSDGGTLRRRLRARLADRGLTGEYPAVLRTAVEAAGFALAADPVAAPPYVVVASRGPVLRGSTGAGRLVLAIRAFGVRSRDAGSDPDACGRYVRTASSIEDALVVASR
jgi:hypothetical protein